jgi:hypothetical protein
MAKLELVNANLFILYRGFGSSKNFAFVGFKRFWLYLRAYVLLTSSMASSIGIENSPHMNISLLEVRKPRVFSYP